MTRGTGDWIEARWPVPKSIRAATTLRTGGVSTRPYDSFNLATHVGDDPEHVRANRNQLTHMLELSQDPCWLNQVHGTVVVDAAAAAANTQADGSFTNRAGIVCAVLTADCLPVFLCDPGTPSVAIVHAGWRGLSAGVIEAGIDAMTTRADSVVAWLGPAISAQAYEVGDDVRNTFVQRRADAASAFRANGPGKWHADLYALARQQLTAAGVSSIHGGDYCTYGDAARFFSYRRDGQCGRMASVIWIAPDR